jgi:hypothetical protein
MKTRYLFSSVAAVAIAFSLPASAQEEQSGEVAESKLEPFFGRISPFYGRISPFEGDISPFWGRISPFENGESDKINPFWGRISPFEGDIESFWGRISPFEDDSELEPFWGRISPFWGRISPFMGDLQANWGRISPFDGIDTASHEELVEQFRQLVAESEAFWGEKVTSETGDDFWDGFAAKVFADFDIDLEDPESLDGFTDAERAAFLFAWYDGLMGFSGLDHVDHWMETANWTPSLTQIQGGGTDTVIGLIDFSITSDADLRDNVMVWDGNDNAAGGHGGAVASLLVADHDGEGLMGIAPGASVAMYNPFDEDGTASWDSVREGVLSVGQAGASVVNMSLGVPGATFDADWMEVYGDWDVQRLFDDTVFVHAAGNDGVAQMDDIDWSGSVDPELIIVGSVGPNGNISAFSNTPGEACFVNGWGDCEFKLKDRFIVAPGEWILVTDGEGGVTRMSGTSFAAPLVTGAIALLHDRWGWLKQHPEETADIIFKTADDLGEKGVDEVYGHGLLNITASQSPIKFKKLYQLRTNSWGLKERYYVGDLEDKKTEEFFEVENGYLTLFEDVGKTYRDFLIPLEDFITGYGTSVDGQEQMLQSYLSEGLVNLGVKKKGKFVWSDFFTRNYTQKAQIGGMQFDAQMFAMPLAEQRQPDSLPMASEFSMTSEEGLTFAFGNGVGAMALSGDASESSTRFDPMRGGANPVLGLASGGGYARLDMPVLEGTTFSVGATNREFEDGYAAPYSGEWTLVNESIPTYKASAAHMSLEQRLADSLYMSAAYTRLEESGGALGTQSPLDGAFDGGTSTNAYTLGTDLKISDRISLTGSATYATAMSDDPFGGLALQEDGVSTSAFEAAMTFDGFINGNDRARIALIQPMHIEGGALSVTNMQVTDRRTGQLEDVTSSYGLVDDRVFALETSWGTTVLDGSGVVAGFVRLESDLEGNMNGREHLAGMTLNLTF